MLTIAHKSGTAGEGKDAHEVMAGQILTDGAVARAAIVAGLADMRQVICTKKHFGRDANAAACACAERAPIDDTALAINALSMGRARLEPPLGPDVKLKFAPRTPAKTASVKAPAPSSFSKKTEKQK
jgi:hypothetical protein